MVTLLAGTVLATSLSGCALAGRVLATADAAAVIRDVAGALPEREIIPATAGSAGARAEIVGTGGSGLRLNDRPGADRLSVYADGTVVTLICRTAGPTVSGPGGESSVWSRVETPDGSTGYMSNAYLDVEPTPACD